MAHVVALVLTLAVVAPAAADMKILEPHDPTWERIFKISWQTEEKKGRPVVEGYIVNASPYTIGQVQLLVDALDEHGNIIAQKVSWLPAPAPAARYQVQSIRSTGSKARRDADSPEPSGVEPGPIRVAELLTRHRAYRPRTLAQAHGMRAESLRALHDVADLVSPLETPPASVRLDVDHLRRQPPGEGNGHRLLHLADLIPPELEKVHDQALQRFPGRQVIKLGNGLQRAHGGIRQVHLAPIEASDVHGPPPER